jgi:hypothetical protein
LQTHSLWAADVRFGSWLCKNASAEALTSGILGAMAG